MPSLVKEYLEYISQQIFPGNAPPEFQYWTFMERFNPNNCDIKSTEISEALYYRESKEGYKSGFNQHLKEVIKKINSQFREQLEEDGFTQQQLGLGEKGNPGRYTASAKSPWQIAYQWLWEIKYYRWLEDYIWENWKQKAPTNVDWIQFCHRSTEYAAKGMKIPPPLPKKTIPINTPLSLTINLDTPGSYLLLFNRGSDEQGNTTQYLVTPSQAFAPNYQLQEKSTSIPLEEAICEDIQFETVGKEEYIGIVIDKAVNLPWLNPNPENPIVEWEGKHLEQVWELLHNRDNWRVFYRDFHVVS
ncbi:MAG TPA: hypothetical protein DEG17_23825 [Cyanobacteria bacterium UBA11149]|nr:hypothetical protein [Cyanobacteria bacterium UBA11367]HBE60831.1 hypothetical protein [Cyanobacteria bacterium UBA11366]HBK66805.1 hypothetical protein [Cyanobacteria bacterium UBA11166]HBR74201.1 hypothetical protein [Cyanobacteria bacterium UBA11159]HBS70441.1 hypothetical protein [Cyanobacteria bacterium UBA11153]HBW91811.1 hypothetical protein [Cyanobacteria bacterium UBA11149]HCA94162.1 hypothetical protein [Cyanobacteria bacterium UBA9226]